MPRLVVGVLLLAAVGLLSPHPGYADEHDEPEHGHEHADEHAHECPEGYEEHEGHCYYFSTDTDTFSGAAAYCEAQDGRLAAPDCHDEHAAEFFYRTIAWINPDTEEDCGGHASAETQLPFICVHAPTCDEPPVQNNTVRYDCDAPYDQQEACRYECAPGYHMFEGTTSSAKATCLDGDWHGPFMLCNPDCPEPTMNPGATKTGESCEAPYITGDMCSFSCEDMQQPISGDHDMSCFGGIWIHASTDLAGDPLVCPPPE